MASRTKKQPVKKQAHPSSSVDHSALEQIVSLSHGDPHSILGIHPRKDGFVIRVFRPEAKEVSLLLSGNAKDPIACSKSHPAGFFETFVTGQTEVSPYQVRVEYPGEKVFTYWDPYCFWPTLGELDLHLFGEGTHERLWERFGAHVMEWQGVKGTAFAVWAPGAKSVSVVGDFNGWDGRLHMMRILGHSGVWEIFIPGLENGVKYKFEIRTHRGNYLLKADPFAFYAECPPQTASVIYESHYQFHDQGWMEARKDKDFLRQPLSIYEVHLESWRRKPEEEDRSLTYRELAVELTQYVKEMGFTHVQFMPVMEHPFGGSWGYQVSSYFAPTARFGTPDDLRYLVDALHLAGIGVILDWVPAHFPKDEFALGRFDGTALYEHLDPRQGEHPDWGTYVFNFGRNEVRNFLMASALYWLSEFHADGLRMDAVASLLYLDYSRKEGEWVPNQYGSNENLEAVQFLKRLSELSHGLYPGTLLIAEESTAWTGVSRPTYSGGLGFTFKWNMGWMHDTLYYFNRDPIHRKYHHNNLTFGFLYAWSENFILPLSHDEVVHGKGSLLDKMPGDRWEKFANLRALYGYMWAHPGKKLIFMGGEFGQWQEWRHSQSLDWHLTQWADHWKLQDLMKDLNRTYAEHPALWEADIEPSGFQWIDVHNADNNIVAFLRKAPLTGRQVACVCNLSPVIRSGYRMGLPKPGYYHEILNTDSSHYGGSNLGNGGGVHSEAVPFHGFSHSVVILLPPLSTLWFEVPD